MIHQGLARLLTVNLGLTPADHLLVLADTPPRGEGSAGWFDRIELAREAVAAAVALGAPATLVLYEAPAASGMEPPLTVWEAAFGARQMASLPHDGVLLPLLAKTLAWRKVAELGLRPRITAALALTERSTSHTRFRRLLTGGGCRYASCPLFSRSMLDGPMSIDWPTVAAVTTRLAARLSQAGSARVECPLGTELTLSLAGRSAHADTGLLTTPGAFGNLPAGEAYIAPVEGSAEGTLVITHAPALRLGSPLRVRIARGRAMAVEGEDAYRVTLEGIFARDRANRVVAELGVGTNPKATNAANVLEAEKIAGTVHVAFGDNSTFGGRNSAPYHGDSVVLSARLGLDGEAVDLSALGEFPAP